MQPISVQTDLYMQMQATQGTCGNTALVTTV